jgi:hypothetical protein
MRAAAVTWDVQGPTPEPWWQAELDRLAPPGQGLQSLFLYWEPGYAWEPVERWIVGRVWPKYLVPLHLQRAWFEGPNPATEGYWDRKSATWVPTGAGRFISRRQWQFWQDHKQVLEPYWVIQGTGAGHRYRLTHPERVISRVHGGPPEAPAPGDLPYATMDMRTLGLLGQRDRMRMHLNTLQHLEREGERLDPEDAMALDAMRSEVWGWLSQQAGEWAEMAASQAARGLWDNAPSLSKEDARRRAEAQERFNGSGGIT